jgi:acarbose 7IV-phosphotransferase
MAKPAIERILVVGGLSWDSIIELGELPEPRQQTLYSRHFHETVGSTGAGKAMNLGRLGFDVTLHAMLGDDAWGARIRERLQREPLRFAHDVDPGGTERHVNLMADSGARISIYTNLGAFEPDVDMDRLEALLADADVLVLNISNYCRRLIPLARRLGKPIWCDIHDWNGQKEYHHDFVAAADFLFLSSDSMPDYRDFMARRVAAGARLVVSTHGSKGATALTAGGAWIETPAVTAAPVVDTNGAGDAFFSGYLYGHARGREPARCMELGAVTAALAVASRELAHPDLSPARVTEAGRACFGWPRDEGHGEGGAGG